MTTPRYTTEQERLGHRIQAHALIIGDHDIASCPADWLGSLGSYDAAKAARAEEEAFNDTVWDDWDAKCDAELAAAQAQTACYHDHD